MEKDLNKIYSFFQQAEELKKTIRFLQRKKMVRESSADHSWKLAIMTFVLINELNLEIDSLKAIKIALLHDLVEAITGDIDYGLIIKGKVSIKTKEDKEIKAIQKIKEILPRKSGREIYSLWHEFNDCQSKEAKFVKALDRIETLTHLVKIGYKSYNNAEFIPNYADEAVRNFPELKELLFFIKKELKKEFKKGNIPWKKEYETF